MLAGEKMEFLFCEKHLDGEHDLQGSVMEKKPTVFPPKHQLFLSRFFSLIVKNGKVELLNYCLASRNKLSLNQIMVFVSSITHG